LHLSYWFCAYGKLLAAFIERKVPIDTDGVFYLRIEDTDQKRSVENGNQGIVDDLKNFEITMDEGVFPKQTKRKLWTLYTKSKKRYI
jgi:glutamyl-tRNA synthetase